MDFLEYVRMCQEESDQERRQQKLCSGLIYKVEAGDTLYSISRRYRLRVRDIMSANPFVNVYNLQIGEELCIPVVPENLPIEGARPYIVKRGDTVMSILEENKISFEELARLNRSVAALRLPPGTILLLPTRIEPRSENINQNEPAQQRTGMSENNQMTGNTAIPENSQMPGRAVMPRNSQMPDGTMMPGNSQMPERTMMPEDDQIPITSGTRE